MGDRDVSILQFVEHAAIFQHFIGNDNYGYAYLAGMVRMRELNEMLLTYLPCELTQEKEEQGNQEKQEKSKMEKSIFTLMEIDIQTGLSYCMNDTRFLTDMILEYESEDMSEPLQQAFVRDYHNAWMDQYQHLLGEIMKIKKGNM